MSVCYHLSCHKCEEYIWVAQGSSRFYSGEPETMKSLGKFLYEHEGHELSFNHDGVYDHYIDFQEKECTVLMPDHTKSEQKKNRTQ